MEPKAIEKRRTSWPAAFDGGWMEKFFNAPLDEFFNLGRVNNIPSVNISETDNEYKLCIAAPGLEKTDFKIEMLDDMLTISAEKEKEEKDERNGRYNRREYNYTSWSRSFTLPENANTDKVDAKYENGELKIKVPKTEVKKTKTGKSISIN
ncbi:MAG TPA: Hsp20/alpha crystallin family protein [Chitinophagaceae bacterium]|nr:Hsp20/alpha crystallin family protein [Chitinophagaceae bacterium]